MLYPRQVPDVLDEARLPVRSTPYGFDLPGGYRLERGSGIAAMHWNWRIVHVKTGRPWSDMPSVSSERVLRRYLLLFALGHRRENGSVRMALSFFVWEEGGERPASANVKAWDAQAAAAEWVEGCWGAIDSPKSVRVLVAEAGS